MNFRVATSDDVAKANARSISRSDSNPPIQEYVYALEDEGVVLAVGGMKLMNPTTAWAFMDWTMDAMNHPKTLYRVVRDWLDIMMQTHGIVRLMAAVECDFPQAIRTAEHLGFVKESVMPYWTGDKPAYLYVRINPPQRSGTGMAGSYSPDLASDGQTEGVQ